MNKVYKSVVLLGTTTLLLTGCGAKDPKQDINFRKERINEYHHTISQMQSEEPLPATLTLHTAIARAIKYNLDIRVKQMEAAVAQQHLNLTRFGYLPNITAMAGYSSRNNEPGSISRSLATGDISLEYSSSQEKQHTLSSLRASWDLLDFGLTCFSVQQESDRIAIAKEQRRKVIQNIIQDVQEAYWRTYIAQQIEERIIGILQQSDEALDRFQALAAKGTVDPKDTLSKQREILQVRYNVRSLQEQLAVGSLHLAALLNVPVNTRFKLEQMPIKQLPILTTQTSRLENLALTNRPELMVEDSKMKINTADIRKSMLELFPHLEFWGQLNHDTNEYLYNKSWSEVGVQLSWQLMKAASSTGRLMSYNAEEKLAEARHTALSMAILSQVHLALNRYKAAASKYDDASKLHKVSDELATLVNRDNLREGKAGFGKIRANLQAVASDMQSMLVYAEVQNALMRLRNTLGLDPLNDLDQNMPLEEMSARVHTHFQNVTEKLIDKGGVN